MRLQAAVAGSVQRRAETPVGLARAGEQSAVRPNEVLRITTAWGHFAPTTADNRQLCPPPIDPARPALRKRPKIAQASGRVRGGSTAPRALRSRAARRESGAESDAAAIIYRTTRRMDSNMQQFSMSVSCQTFMPPPDRDGRANSGWRPRCSGWSDSSYYVMVAR
jgi:hypothetical protein